MCQICGKNPCWSGCPNEPEPPSVFICSGCGEPIRHGEAYWDVMGEQFCEHCMDEARSEATYDPE